MSLNQKTSSYLLAIFSIFVLFFITTSQYSKLQEKFDTKDILKSELEEKKDELTKLNSIQKKLESNGDEIEKYTLNFNEDEIIKYIYDYAFNESNFQGSELEEIKIKNISFSKGVKNELGFIESNINLNIRVGNEKSMIDFINFLLKKDSKYTFFINNFNYPYDNRDGKFDVNIPLKLFYIN